MTRTIQRERPHWARLALAALLTVGLMIGAWFIHGGAAASACAPTTRAVERAFRDVAIDVHHTNAAGDCAFDGADWLTVSVTMEPTSAEDFAALRAGARQLAEDPSTDGGNVEIVVDAGPVTLRLLNWEDITAPVSEMLWRAHQAGVEVVWDQHRRQSLTSAAEGRGAFELTVRADAATDETLRDRIDLAVDLLRARPSELRAVPVLRLEWERDGSLAGAAKLLFDDQSGRNVPDASELIALVDDMAELGDELGRIVRIETSYLSSYLSPSPATPGGHEWTPEQTATAVEIEERLASWGHFVTSFTGEREE